VTDGLDIDAQIRDRLDGLRRVLNDPGLSDAMKLEEMHSVAKRITEIEESNGPLCQCGCRQPAPIASRTDRKAGYVKGEPKRFISGHVCRYPTPDAHFFAYASIQPIDQCWEWRGARDPNGYGTFTVARKVTHFAHRYAYELFVGPIPEGLVIDHLCRNRGCINPTHMEPVTNAENVLRGEGPTAVNARKTHCKRGHPFDDVNTYVYAKGRACRMCHQLRQRAAAGDEVAQRALREAPTRYSDGSTDETSEALDIIADGLAAPGGDA
jgi:hypothetical protein